MKLVGKRYALLYFGDEPMVVLELDEDVPFGRYIIDKYADEFGFDKAMIRRWHPIEVVEFHPLRRKED